MTIKELREKRAKILTEARERLDQINTNTDEARTSELEGQHDTAMAEYDRLGTQIEREERLAQAEQRETEQRERLRPKGKDVEARGQGEDDDTIEYRHVFAKVICGGLDDLSQEERAVLRQGVAKFEQRAQTAGTTTAGGYTVPTELAAFIDKAMKDWGPMYDEDICTVITTGSGNPMKIPTVDDTASTAVAHTEATALTDDGSKDVVFGQKSLDAFAFDTEFLRWSWELDSDSIFSMESLLGALLGERTGRIANLQLTTGTGSGAPNGVVVASSLGKTAVSATAITADELMEFQHSVNSAYRRSPKCRWMFADTTLLAIRKLKDGQGNYLWQMGDVKTGAPDVLLGKPYSINDDVPAIATGNKAVIFGDFSRYYVRKVGAPIIGVLRERFWPDMGIAGLIRFDGELGQAGAIKHYKLA
jgi:HK97 family phage major capsid protein